MLGVLVAPDKDLDVGLLVHLLLGPFGYLFLGELLPHHHVGSVLADVDLGQVARGLGQGLVSGVDREVNHVVDFLLLEGGGDEEKDNQDEHGVDHARDVDDIPLLGGAPAPAVHDSLALSAAFLAAGFLPVALVAFLAESACCATKAVPDSSI